MQQNEVFRRPFQAPEVRGREDVSGLVVPRPPTPRPTSVRDAKSFPPTSVLPSAETSTLLREGETPRRLLTGSRSDDSHRRTTLWRRGSLTPTVTSTRLDSVGVNLAGREVRSSTKQETFEEPLTDRPGELCGASHRDGREGPLLSREGFHSGHPVP